MKTLDISLLKLGNKDELKAWRSPLMELGYGFTYKKGSIEGYEGIINVGIECNETGEFFPLYWKEPSIEGHSPTMLLKKCKQLKGTDGEGWFIADIFEKWLFEKLN